MFKRFNAYLIIINKKHTNKIFSCKNSLFILYYDSIQVLGNKQKRPLKLQGKKTIIGSFIPVCIYLF